MTSTHKHVYIIQDILLYDLEVRMFLDIAFGIVVAVLWDATGLLTLTKTSLITAIVFSLLPDLDGIISVVGRMMRRQKFTDKYSHEHRELLHHPLPYVVFGGVAVAILSLSPTITLMFIVLSLLHFAHDSAGIGWGLRWNSPWSQIAYKWFSDQEGRFAWAIAKWTPAQQRAVAEKRGDPNWIKNIYLKPSPIALIEGGGFILSLCVLWLYS